MIGSQLPLGVLLRDDATLESFYPSLCEGNQQALVSVRQAARKKGEPFIYLWGTKGVGRSHLLQGACHEACSVGLSALYLPLSAPFLKQQNTQTLQGLEQIDLICIDDIQTIAGNAEWEEAFFHFFNRLRDSGKTTLIVAADISPRGLPIQLPDLKSRLSWGVVFHLQPLPDDEKWIALQLRAKVRGIELNEEVGRFLLRRCGRNMSVLYQILDQLDNASLAAQRKITIPFVKAVLQV